jgi:kynurenine formamidase
MRRTHAAIVAAAAVAIAFTGVLSAQQLPGPTIVDLGHPLSDADPTWTGRPVFKHTTSLTEGILVGSFETDEHFGTHVDAPAHFFHGGLTVDQIPVSHLVRPAVRIDLRAATARNEDYRMTRADIVAFERKNGAIEPGTIVLVMTGWDARWNDPQRYRNEHDGSMHFPGLSVEAAETLLKRDVAAIGIDTPSVDYGASNGFEVHHVTLPKSIYHVENAANLAAIPATGFTVVVAPIDIKGGSGAPARVFAVVRP